MESPAFLPSLPLTLKRNGPGDAGTTPFTSIGSLERRRVADQLSTAWNLEIENKLAQQIESFAG